MTDELGDFSAQRAAVTLAAPPGARERVLRRLVATEERRDTRPLRALVLVLATLVTTTAAALGVSVVPRWVERHRALAAGSHTPVTPAPAKAPSPRHVAPPATPASPVPGPDLPAAPPPEPEPQPVAAPVPLPTASPRASVRSDATPVSPSESLLAQQVAAFREASSLVQTSPGLAIVRLRAFQERWPTSPLGEEASIRLVQALVALGRDADARAQAGAFIARYPASPRRGEMEALASGAPLKRASE